MPDLNEQYHSKHGALQEALHVFVKMGLEYFLEVSLSRKRDFIKEPLHILEYGFGTGLNAMITVQHYAKTPIHYTGVEAFSVTADEVKAMDYGSLLNDQDLYKKIHAVPWEQPSEINEQFILEKQQKTFEKIADLHKYDLVFFDAFGPRTQPELWTEDTFLAAFKALKPEGVLTTYCAAGQVRRNLQAVGFQVERLPGPPGKREMLRGTKPNFY